MGKMIDLVGKRFGFWLVKERGKNSKTGQIQWLCTCECKKEKLITSNSLRSGNSTSCGCNHKPDLVGEKFGRLTVKSLATSQGNGRRYWICTCDCGKEITVSTYSLREKHVISCGHDLTDVAEEVITISETLRQQCEEGVAKGYDLIKQQTQVLTNFNVEIQKSISLLTALKCYS